MPVTVYRMDDEAIIIATFTGDVTSEDLVAMYGQTNQLIGADPQVARITDFRHVNTDTTEMLRIFTVALQSGSGATSDPRVLPILLGENRWSQIARDSMKRAFNIEIPIFATIGEAVQAARQHLLQQR